mgnify:CR=1 FL=1
MFIVGQDSLKTRRTLCVGGKDYDYFSLEALAECGFGDVQKLPVSMKILLENLLRSENGRTVLVEDIKAVANWAAKKDSMQEIAYRPARVLMQDFTGVPAVVDLASMRDAMIDSGGDPLKINPLSPVDLVVDHSLMVDHTGTHESLGQNVKLEFERNQERYGFLKWGQGAFKNMRVVPPGTGICHQVNLEYLSRVIWTEQENGREIAFPDTLVGTDSHTTMANGLSVLGWGVGGIEAEAVMLGQPITMLIPEVVGFKLTGFMTEGITATDLVLTIVEMLRKKDVVGKFVEFYGPGLDNLTIADQATIANMAPEYGATCGFFPITDATLEYMTFTGRSAAQVSLIEAYAKAQGMWRDASSEEPTFTDTLDLDLAAVVASIAGPKRPQDRIKVTDAGSTFKSQFTEISGGRDEQKSVAITGTDYELKDGAVMYAAITSCTNTSNPSVLVAAGLVAKKAHEKGLSSKPWVKTSLAPGSQVVSEYLGQGGLQKYLDKLGFHVVGYGCGSCIGNSGMIQENFIEAVEDNSIVVAAVLSSNRNFEGRVSPWTKANYLASPPLVVVYALAGNMNFNLLNDALGEDHCGNAVFLKDIWPTNKEIEEYVNAVLTPEMFRARYNNLFDGEENWKNIKTKASETYKWSPGSTYIQKPPFFDENEKANEPRDILDARPLAMLGSSITTDHISPAGFIHKEGPAGAYLLEHQVRPRDFNSFGARRGNHEVMIRGTFANPRIKNDMVPNTEGGWTSHQPSGEIISIFEAAMRYKEDHVPLIVFGGADYGMGSSRDWAAKGTRLLGVDAVIVESFERIHRSNLVGMGVLPLEFKNGETRQHWGLNGTETFDLIGLADGITPGMNVILKIKRENGGCDKTTLLCRVDTLDEADYYVAGGILKFVLNNLKNTG